MRARAGDPTPDVRARHLRQCKTCLRHHCTTNMPPTHWLGGVWTPATHAEFLCHRTIHRHLKARAAKHLSHTLRAFGDVTATSPCGFFSASHRSSRSCFFEQEWQTAQPCEHHRSAPLVGDTRHVQ